MADGTCHDPDLLLRHLDWVRALAGRLVRDPAAADDLAQDACVLALQHQPSLRASDPRGWLRAVLRSLVGQRRRAAERRSRHEHGLAVPDQAPATDELVVRAQAQQQLVQAVLALEPALRDAVLLRWFEGLAPRDIARLTGAPVATVQSRLSRAHARLRAQLDHLHGGRARWLAALAPLAPTLPAGTAAGGAAALALTMNAKTLISAAAVLVAALSFTAYALSRTDGEARSRVVAAPGGDGAPASSGSNAGGGGPGAAGRAPVPAAPGRGEAPAAAATPAAVLFAGRVIEADGTPRPGVALADAVAPTEPLARSGPGGRFEVRAVPPAELTVQRLPGRDAEWVALRDAALHDALPADREPVLVLARAITCAGVVLDGSMRPLPAAHVRLELPDDLAARLGLPLEATMRRGWRGRADADGRFELDACPAVQGATLRAVLDGYAATEIDAPLQSDRSLQIVLRRPTAPQDAALAGVVLTAAGEPAAAARVALGLTAVLADERGQFTLDLAKAVTADELRAVLAGHQAAVLERPAAADGPRGGWPEFVELRLGPPALTLRGRVVRASGGPVPDARVWLDDPTRLGVIGHMPVSAEALAAGADVPPQALESQANLPDADGDDFYDYGMSNPPATAAWHYVDADRDGRFTLPGLSSQPYHLRVLDRSTLQLHRTEPVLAADGELVVVLPAPEQHPEVRGRVLVRGEPVAGARLALMCMPFQAASRVRGGSVRLDFLHVRERLRTDGDGRFVLHDVPRHGCRLRVAGDGVVPMVVELDDLAVPGNLTIEAEGRCSVRVQLRPPTDRADRVAAVDADGRPLDVLVLTAGSTNAYTDLPLFAGRSEVFSLSTRAHRLVLSKDGAVVGTVHLDLRGDQVHVVEW